MSFSPIMIFVSTLLKFPTPLVTALSFSIHQTVHRCKLQAFHCSCSTSSSHISTWTIFWLSLQSTDLVVFTLHQLLLKSLSSNSMINYQSNSIAHIANLQLSYYIRPNFSLSPSDNDTAECLWRHTWNTGRTSYVHLYCSQALRLISPTSISAACITHNYFFFNWNSHTCFLFLNLKWWP